MGIMPSEFWAMTPHEFLTLVDLEADSQPVSKGGKMTKSMARELAEDIEMTDEEWWQKNGSPINKRKGNG